MAKIADWINRAIENRGNKDVLNGIRLEVRALCDAFPLYPDMERDNG